MADYTEQYASLRKLAMAADVKYYPTDAAYIAAASPDVVLGLLDRIRPLEAANIRLLGEMAQERVRVEKLEEFLADLANMTPYRITGEALTPTQLRELIEQIALQAETILLEKK